MRNEPTVAPSTADTMARKTERSITPILLIKSHTKQGYETLLYNNTNNLIHQIIEVHSPLDFTKLSIELEYIIKWIN